MSSGPYVTTALGELRHHWGSAYEITGALGAWRAERRDNQAALHAGNPDELRELIRADYEASPVPRPALRAGRHRLRVVS